MASPNSIFTISGRACSRVPNTRAVSSTAEPTSSDFTSAETTVAVTTTSSFESFEPSPASTTTTASSFALLDPSPASTTAALASSETPQFSSSSFLSSTSPSTISTTSSPATSPTPLTTPLPQTNRPPLPTPAASDGNQPSPEGGHRDGESFGIAVGVAVGVFLILLFLGAFALYKIRRWRRNVNRRDSIRPDDSASQNSSMEQLGSPWSGHGSLHGREEVSPILSGWFSSFNFRNDTRRSISSLGSVQPSKFSDASSLREAFEPITTDAEGSQRPNLLKRQLRKLWASKKNSRSSPKNPIGLAMTTSQSDLSDATFRAMTPKHVRRHTEGSVNTGNEFNNDPFDDVISEPEDSVMDIECPEESLWTPAQEADLRSISSKRSRARRSRLLGKLSSGWSQRSGASEKDFLDDPSYPAETVNKTPKRKPVPAPAIPPVPAVPSMAQIRENLNASAKLARKNSEGVRLPSVFFPPATIASEKTAAAGDVETRSLTMSEGRKKRKPPRADQKSLQGESDKAPEPHQTPRTPYTPRTPRTPASFREAAAARSSLGVRSGRQSDPFDLDKPEIWDLVQQASKEMV